MRNTSLLLISLCFFILFSTSVLASYSIDVNVTLTGDQPLTLRGMDCTNATGTVYCYLATQCNSGAWCIERYNATWGDKQECEWNSLGYTGDNFALINSTHGYTHNDPPQNDYFLVPIQYIDLNTTCPYTLVESNFNFTEDFYQAGTLYNAGYTDSELYFSKQDLIVNGSTGQDIRAGWGLTELESVSFPNETDNTTAYSKSCDVGEECDNSVIYKVNNGLSYQEFDNPYDIYGIEESSPTQQFTALDWLYVDSSTTYLFMVHNGRAYRMNWTEYESSYIVPVITAISPINNASALTNPAQLRVTLASSVNGSIAWSIDGSVSGTTTVTVDGTTQNYYFTSPTGQTTGYHYWVANFTDSNNRSWATPVQWFSQGTADIFTDPLEAIAQQVGYFFSIEDLNTAKDIFAVLCSMFLSCLIVVGLGLIAKGKMHFKAMVGMVPALTLFFLVVFGLAGFLSLGMGLLIGAIVLLLIFYMVKSGA